MKDRKKLLDRARKLYAMSNDSASPAEAEIAAKRLRKIMAEHQITADDIKNSQPSDFRQSTQDKFKRSPTWYSYLGNAASKLCECRLVCYGSKRIIEGFDDDVTLAELTLEYFYNSLVNALNQYQDTGDRSRHDVSAFKLGFAVQITRRVRDLMEEETRQQASEQKGLVILKGAMIEREYGKLGKRTTRPKIYSGNGFDAGKSAAENVGLNSQINHEKTAQIS